ncbi:pilus assembly FimT family protein [Zestomonas carbonaria]|uniref:pilus assembly FimT family protein n=1 Tax=Zestomonas carbonaria TaxID=2762745 RepID=UPI0016576199|nr:prepilin-type N-terminal cleavage/methylation domain-containing protein [Pseudomonas carbonaria]
MMQRASGFTLIELMVTIAVMAMLIMLAAPFASGWTERAQLNSAESIWREAYGRAKAAALRNRHGAHGDQVVSFLCLNDGALGVRVARDADTPASCSSTELWKSALPSRLKSLRGGGTTEVSCFAFDNRGNLLPEKTCATNNDLELRYGHSSVSISLY